LQAQILYYQLKLQRVQNVFFFIIQIDVSNDDGVKINPCKKSWQCIADFLIQFTDGGTIFSMMDGLATVAQAAYFVGGWNVVAFESDRDIWRAGYRELAKFIDYQEKKELSISREIDKQIKLQKDIIKLKNEGPIDINKEEMKEIKKAGLINIKNPNDIEANKEFYSSFIEVNNFYNFYHFLVS